jgi:hypothetical protein
LLDGRDCLWLRYFDIGDCFLICLFGGFASTFLLFARE